MFKDLAHAVPLNYDSSRQQFLQVAQAIGAAVESFPLSEYQQVLTGSAEDSTGDSLSSPLMSRYRTPSGADSFSHGPDGEPLYLDAVHLGPTNARVRLIASCGLHGVEAFFGAAVLTAWLADLEQQSQQRPRNVRVTLLHALNPHGFAWTTRVNEDNIDPNRNFLLPGEEFAGCPETYRQIHSLLNPDRLPPRWEPFRLKMLGVLLRHGMAALKQAIAGGQYEYPHGLFYGGAGPAATQRLLAAQLPQWTSGTKCVLHIDYHTGLGRRGKYAILCDEKFGDADRELLRRIFGRDKISEPDSEELDYSARGSIGRWYHHVAGGRYLTAGPEYGTYPPLTMLSGLREDNAARRHLPYDHPRRRQARDRLRELFCPASPRWRRWAIRTGADMLHQALAVMEQME